MTARVNRGRRVAGAMILVAGLSACSFGSFGGGASQSGWNPQSNAPPVPAAKPAPPVTTPDRGAQARSAPAQTVVAVPLEQSEPQARVEPAALPAPETGPPLRYRVQPGDSLYGLSRRFGTPIRAIIVANEMEPPYRLSTGQTLEIPRPLVHLVQPGDTAYGVSRRYGVDLTEMVRLNDIPPPYTLVPGQRLAMPGGDLRATATEVDDAPGAPAPERRSGAAVTPGEDPADRTTSTPSVAAAAPDAASSEPARQKAALPPPRGSIPQPPPRAEDRFLWPLEGQLVARFGSRSDGVHNDGINIAAPRGTPVRAAENGVVAYVGEELRGFGRLLLIKHDGGWVTAYAHNDSILVRRGDIVRRGQVVARVGSSGNVARPQLHFEVRRGTRAVDPLTVLVAAETAAR